MVRYRVIPGQGSRSGQVGKQGECGDGIGYFPKGGQKVVNI